ncbi:MAG: hypothetical protein ACLQVD_10015 [Capsulimonadaceae bacterium]
MEPTFVPSEEDVFVSIPSRGVEVDVRLREAVAAARATIRVVEAQCTQVICAAGILLALLLLRTSAVPLYEAVLLFCACAALVAAPVLAVIALGPARIVPKGDPPPDSSYSADNADRVTRSTSAPWTGPREDLVTHRQIAQLQTTVRRKRWVLWTAHVCLVAGIALMAAAFICPTARAL